MAMERRRWTGGIAASSTALTDEFHFTDADDSERAELIRLGKVTAKG
jgi:hypothetical protein